MCVFNEGIGLLLLFAPLMLEMDFERLMKFLSVVAREYYSENDEEFLEGLDEDEIEFARVV